MTIDCADVEKRGARISFDVERRCKEGGAEDDPREAREKFERTQIMRSGSDAQVKITDSFIIDMFRHIDQGKWDDLAKFFATNATYERPGYAPLTGRDSIMKFYREERIVASGSHSIDDCIIDLKLDRGLASCWGSFEGLSRNGEKLKERFADIYELRDGKITLRRTYFFRPAI